MGGGAWWAAVHGVSKSQTRLSDFTFTFTLLGCVFINAIFFNKQALLVFQKLQK